MVSLLAVIVFVIGYCMQIAAFQRVSSLSKSLLTTLNRIQRPTTLLRITMSTFLKIDANVALQGAVDAESLSSLAKSFTGLLYLCPDAAGDCGIEGGFSTIAATFPKDMAHHVSINSNEDIFQPEFYQTKSSLAIHAAVTKFAALERALDALLPAGPTIIMCKSNRRAGLVWATYTGVKQGKTAEEVLAMATEKGLSYLGSAGFVAWSSAVVTQLRKPMVPLLFRQMYEAESSTYTYLLADEQTKEAILIDPVLETVERDLEIIKNLGLTLKYMLNTHCHADHITGTGKIKQLLAATGTTCQSMISKASSAMADIHLVDGDKVQFGSRYVMGFSTPGHTAGCFTFILDDFSLVFSGDALLIRSCGRTDFQEGSSEQLYHAVHSRILCLRDNTAIYPAHDYKGLTSTSVVEERTCNPRLTKTLPEFVEIMANLQLPYPKKLDASLPANLKCGL